MSGYLKKSLPAQTTPAMLSLSGIMAVSQILKLYYCIYKPVGTVQLAPVISACEIYPSHSHTRYSRVQTKNKDESTKGN